MLSYPDVKSSKGYALVTSAVLGAFAIGALLQRLGGWPFPGHAGPRLEFLGTLADPTRTARGRFFVPKVARGKKDLLRWHPVAGHVYVPHARLEWDWPEYERGTMHRRINNLGFCRDTAVTLDRPADTYRVLVTGDSHVAGFVDNDHNFCHLLEQKLTAATGRRYEVLNAGVIASGPHNYAGQIERHYDMELDCVLVVVYGGNDFLNACSTAAVRGTLTYPERSPEELDAIERATDYTPVQQGANQAFLFGRYPDLRDRVEAEVRDQIRWIRTLTHRSNLELVIALLPTKDEVEWPRMTEDALRAAYAVTVDPLGMRADELRVNREMTVRLRDWLAEADFRAIDLHDPLTRAGGKLFWDTDYHLATAGHRAVAEALVEPILDVSR